MKRIGLFLVCAVLAAGGVLGKRYYDWAAKAETPFDEVGIGLHHYMPAPIRAWGCEQLRARFEGKTLPPAGCQDSADPRRWRKA